MTTPRIGIRYAARSDVGMLREGNEDSAFAGARLLAVADGMGGHVGGEIASAAAIETLRKLDTEVPADQLLVALEHSVRAANDRLHTMVEGDPSLQGMGTTLTAMLWSGTHIALVHIGDSRAYLLRNGELFQITHDHTLVQSLVDEGRISLDDAATHPQRSLLLRALDGRSEVEPDLSLREAHVGDRYLLCSDGLSGVVSAETIHQVLTGQADPEQAVRQLIDLANRGGGPDNITCVVADVINLNEQAPVDDKQVLAGAAANKVQEVQRAVADTPAQRAADHIRDTMPQPPLQLNGEFVPPPSPAPQQQQQYGAAPPAPMAGVAPTAPQRPPRRRTRGPLLLGAVGVTGLLVIAAGYFGYSSLTSGYYLKSSGDKVEVFKGKNQEVFGKDFSSKAKDVTQPTTLLADLPREKVQEVQQKKITASDKAGINQKIKELAEATCDFLIQEVDRKVVIKRESKCSDAVITHNGREQLPEVKLDALKPETKRSIEDGALKFDTLPKAVEQLNALKQEADQQPPPKEN